MDIAICEVLDEDLMRHLDVWNVNSPQGGKISEEDWLKVEELHLSHNHITLFDVS